MLATCAHDAIMTPLDLLKQRIQLGNYQGLTHAMKTVVRNEGFGALFVALPTTLVRAACLCICIDICT
jgi:solute carrier family 25 iron transporter 28/37